MHRAQWIAQQHGLAAVLYVVTLYGNDGEPPFYKVGITFCLSQRFRTLRFAGYKWRTVARWASWNAGAVFDMEQRLHRELAGFSYRPFLQFSGSSEYYASLPPLLAALPSGVFVLKNLTTLI